MKNEGLTPNLFSLPAIKRMAIIRRSETRKRRL